VTPDPPNPPPGSGTASTPAAEAPPPRVRTKLAARLVRSLGIIALFVAAALFGTASGVLFAFIGDLPEIRKLDDYNPNTITRVLARDGSIVGEFATERRQVVTYDQIPEVLRHAIIAAEDGEFESHGGLRVGRILITLAKDIIHQRMWGASTITQQLARKLFLTDDQTPARKIKEALLAIQIEKRFTKQEIFTMYCNQVYWGHYVYGVEAASQLYFAKSAKDLTLGEAAMIAGIIQGNVRQSPYVNMPKAVERRNYALGRMRDEGYITAEQAAEEMKQPIVTRGEPTRPPSIAPYFLETIRTRLEDQYGTEAVYEDGLLVKTGLDPALQRAVNRALDDGLRRFDKRRGYRRPTENVLAGGKIKLLDDYRPASWRREPLEGDIARMVVTDVEAAVLRVRHGRLRGVIDRKGYEWTKKRPAELARVGDLVEVRVLKLDAKGTFTGELEQPSQLEGAVIAIDNRTGHILAMAGGASFERSQFNRATQAMRQVGSLFKPFVYMTAIDLGETVRTEIVDEPTSFEVGAGQAPYEPKNYDREFHGPMSLRYALEQSRNVPAVRLMQQLGPAAVIKNARQLGISTPLPPYLSVAIGAAEGTLLEMTSAYSAFPNGGVRMAPHAILEVTDRQGNLLEQHRAEPHEAIRADTAYIMTSLLESVVKRGTAVSAASLNWPLGGKTGTTDDYTDAWFVGFDPDITIGVWVGFDQKKTIAANATGTLAALPIWENIMRSWITRQRAARPDPPVFERPGNVVLVVNDQGVVEAFVTGTEPGRN
jgi:penicillin-binding protein 1A